MAAAGLSGGGAGARRRDPHAGARQPTQALGQAVFTNIPRGPLEYRAKFPDSFDGSPLVDHDDGNLVVRAGTTVDQAIALVKLDLRVDGPKKRGGCHAARNAALAGLSGRRTLPRRYRSPWAGEFYRTRLIAGEPHRGRDAATENAVRLSGHRDGRCWRCPRAQRSAVLPYAMS